jgi:exosome complex exonuclease RRP6
MFNYARSDTHFLLYIYDNMRNELVEKSKPSIPDENLIEHVLNNSKEYSLLRYERFNYDENGGKGPLGWYNLLVKTPAMFNKEQFSVFRAIHQWRDKLARDLDDSTSFIMPKHVIFKIAREMPMDIPSLRSVSHPISPPVRTRTTELLGVVRTAKAAGINGPDMMDIIHNNLGPDIVHEAFGKPAQAVKQTRPMNLSSPPGFSQSDPPRLLESKFWGKTLGSSLWDDEGRDNSDMSDIRLAVPLPQLTAEVFSDACNDNLPASAAPEPVDAGARAAHAYVKDRPTSTIDTHSCVFVIKGGRKRRHSAPEGSEPARAGQAETEATSPSVGASKDAGSYTGEGEDNASSAVERKEAKKKVVKRGKRGRRRNNRVERELAKAKKLMGEEGNEPFDYANATSVLHAPAPQVDKSAFDPYRKAADAPKGVKRRDGEKMGKSKTFGSLALERGR